MNKPVLWYLWSSADVVDAVPRFISKVESNIDRFPEEHRVKNQTAVESLKLDPLTVSQISDRSRNRDLVTLAFALDFLGVGLAKHPANIDETLEVLQGAHELFRSTDTFKSGATRSMRQVLTTASKAIIVHEAQAIKSGQSDAGVVSIELNDFITSAWGDVPPEMTLEINEMLLSELERIRSDYEDDSTLHVPFIIGNIDTVLAMELPTRLEATRARWEEIGEHVAPAAVRLAKRSIRRPVPLSSLLSSILPDIEKCVAAQNIAGLGAALSKVEGALETNLRLRLDAKAEYRRPAGEVRFGNGPDRYFVTARDLLLRKDRRSLNEFERLHYRKSNNNFAKEWYAYALSVFGKSTDVIEIIDLLSDTIASEFYSPELNWTARWNLACALRSSASRADEALDVLLPVLDNDYHTNEVFELCLLWALDQNRSSVLPALLLKSPFYEAHLLAAFYDADSLENTQGNTQSRSQAQPDFFSHFRRIGRILNNPDRVFPDPNENLDARELDRLTGDFTRTALISAGVEWFRQHTFVNTRERNFYKNWECAAILNEADGNIDAAWRCYEVAWGITRRSHALTPDVKAQLLDDLLGWALKHGFKTEALRVLREGWRNTSMENAQELEWERRLGVKNVPVAENVLVKPPSPLPPSPPDNPDETIRRLARSFDRVTTTADLAQKQGDVDGLLAATMAKEPSLDANALEAIRAVVRLAVQVHGGVDEQQSQHLATQMKEQLVGLRQHQQSLPYHLDGLSKACERVVQKMAVLGKAVAKLNITTPDGLKVRIPKPPVGQTIQSRCFARLHNPGPEDMKEIRVAFSTLSPGIRFLQEEIALPYISVDGKQIIEGEIEVSDEVESEVEIRVHVTYETGGVTRSDHASGRVAVEYIGQRIPSDLRYITSRPVDTSRTDVFHGRDKDLEGLMDAFTGGQLLKLYFVNGIRRVGKSSLMQHLGRHMGSDVLSLLLDMEDALGGQRMTSVQLVRQLIRVAISRVQEMPEHSTVSLKLPTAEDFAIDPPWTVFETFLDDLKRQVGAHRILVCFDEVQKLVEQIAAPADPMDDGFLAWLRGKVQSKSNTLVICTGSEAYVSMRQRYAHALWANMEPYDISFIDRSAMERIATLPVLDDGVVWIPEALDRLWDMTEGHPWIIQTLAERIMGMLNDEHRRIVGPADVDRASDAVIASDSRVSELWWNEQDDLVTKHHRQVAFLILQNQTNSRSGLQESVLADVCQRSSIPRPGRYLEEMKRLEVLTQVDEPDEPRWRIRGAFLEKYLLQLMQRENLDKGTATKVLDVTRPLALMVDWENARIELSKWLDAQPPAKREELKRKFEANHFATRLVESATRYGEPRQRWAVADWDRPFFQGDQKAVKRARFYPDVSGEEKKDSSDKVLVEHIHKVLREYPHIDVYVIVTGDGDFNEVISTLREHGKHVIIWSAKAAINKVYKQLREGPDRIHIEWLEDVVFEDQEVAA